MPLPPGGGIWNDSTCTVFSSTLSGNSSGGYGGSLRNDGTCTVVSSTLSDNSANTGGGIGRLGGGILHLTSSIVAGNTATTSDPNILGPLATDTHNITTGNPLLAPLINNGGPTQTMALRPGSTARNTGSPTARTTDQRGFPLVGPPDIGAYEAGTLTNFANFIWETLHATATEPQHDATFDFDGDGAANGDEWLAFTDPTSPTSYLRVTSFTRSGNFVSVAFPTVAGRNYTFEFTDTLNATTVWTPLPGSYPGNDSVQNFPSAPSTASQNFSSASASRRSAPGRRTKNVGKTRARQHRKKILSC